MIIPKEIKNTITELNNARFEAYIVGGCVRDFILSEVEGFDHMPKDWDITTNAKPEEIQKIFPDSFYENKFLTVTLKNKIEITTYRTEQGYSDKRHPDEVKYANTLQEDLSRRDFTVNAMALRLPFDHAQGKHSGQATEIVDLFDGQKDIKNKIIKTVGNPKERFTEDALRMLRAVRFACQLGFIIEENTANAIKENSIWLEAVSQERIRDEFVKIIMSDNPAIGIELLRELNLLKYVLPELIENIGIGQNKHHKLDCYWHAVKALEFTAKKKFNFHVRLASLLHDIAKPRVKVGEGENSTFYNHEIVGAKMTFQILNRLKFSQKDIKKITKLVRYHLFYYNTDQVGESSVRRLVRQVGPENIQDLLLVRQADRIGSGVPKAEPYKLRHLKYLIEKVAKDPISAKMLKINGQDVMELLSIKPGPKIGYILDILLGQVLDNPDKNKKQLLEKEIEKLGKLSDEELQNFAEKANVAIQQVETKEDQMTKAKYWVT